jgi:hypothetical protein
MTGGAPTIKSKKNAELAPQFLDRGSRKTHIRRNTTLPAVMIVQQLMTARSTRRRKKGEESGQDRTRDKPTSKRVAMRESMRESSNTANVPVGCRGILEEEGVATRSMPYKTVEKDNPVASSVQTVMFSDTMREDSSGIPE